MESEGNNTDNNGIENQSTTSSNEQSVNSNNNNNNNNNETKATTPSPPTATKATTTPSPVVSPTASSLLSSPTNTSSTNAASPSTIATASPNTTASTTTSTTSTSTSNVSPSTQPSGPLAISSSMPAVGKRLNVQIETLENRINNDMYDTEAWTLLLNEVQSQPISIARDIYQRFLAVFPTAGRYWKLYVEQEMAEKNYEIVEKIFLENLRNVKNVEFWKTYINYIKQVKSDSNNREEIIKAFEFALESVGMDISSTSIWTDYIAFLKEEKATTPFEEGQKMTGIRKLYQRAIENPMHDLDNIYKEYEVYENSINKTLAKALLADHQNRYQHARNVYRDRKALLEGILRNMLAKPPRSSDKEEHQVRLWRKLISFERSNPQKFDPVVLRNRVVATYNQCLLCLYHYPDIWYEAATYQADSGNVDGCISMFDRAIQALPKNLFIHFAYADFLESQKKTQQAKEIYEKIITNNPEPLVWIQYMKFSRRTERVEGPRKIFKRAKSTPECTYHVYIALGLIEYYINQDTRMARDIFEIGLKKFPNEIAFINFYIEFLTNLNEENNTRVLFEKLLSNQALEKSEPLWKKFLDFEYRQNQDVASIFKLEKRYQVSVPSSDKTGVLQALNRYKFLNLWSCHPTEIEIITKNILEDHTGTDHHKDVDSKDDTGADGTAKSKLGKTSKKGKNKEAKNQPVAAPVETKSTSSTIIPVSTWKVKRPDLTQMIPYRSEIGKFTPSSVIPLNQQQQQQQQQQLLQQQRGNIPDFIVFFLQNLPNVNQFNGPFVDPDQLINLIRDTPLPGMQSGFNQQQQQVLQRQQQMNQQSQQQQQQQPPLRASPTISPENINLNPTTNAKPSNIHKRKQIEESSLEDVNSPSTLPTSNPSNQTPSASKAPSNDIYRKRQANKLSKKS
ncbi:hypothetical protein DICPUDRAFT_153358 [Dictyostelium purpureum]|uniref:Suppressor of forked domain-containing protein n=1 Tax=Dictyostelium purpureum TaxID=5786 RepID=F0ZNP6_DICPU|nr:uncharacterized protein DICPUDRAFT_153358 [Dictyostelium purpureum]EGC34447.1 hypothetical protein DICPUDRAFT_153358 [Dictyostelium purpureum]|eukprot:XP_003289032.1 hypothetical protein DICPUDRAFT_153358 [Dictyostelium purpureum]